MQKSPGSLLTPVYLASFLYQVSLNIYGPFLPVFAATLGASYLQIGIIGLAGALIQVPTSLVFGRFSDKLPVKRLMWLACVLAASTIALLSVVQNVAEIVGLLLFVGLGSGMFWPTADALVSEVAVSQPREKVLGRYSASWGTGLLVGPLLGGYVVTYFGYRGVFLVSAFTLSICLATVLLGIIPHYAARPIRQEDKPDPAVAAPRKRPNQYAVAALAAITSFLLGMIYLIFPRYAASLSITPIQLGYLFSTYAVTRLMLFFMSHRVAMAGIVKSLGLSLVLLAVAGAILGLASNFYVFLVAFSILGVAAGIQIPLIMNLYARTNSGRGMTRTMGVYETVTGAGIVSGSFSGGAISNFVSPAVPYLMTAGIALATFPLVVIAGRGDSESDRAASADEEAPVADSLHE